MSKYSSYGTSQAIMISAEDLDAKYYNSSARVDETVKPPEIALGGAVSHAMEKWVNPWASITFKKITEPKYDGIADRLGFIGNQPDLINEQHFIELMRLTEKYLAPDFRTNILAVADLPAPNSPPAPPENQRNGK